MKFLSVLRIVILSALLLFLVAYLTRWVITYNSVIGFVAYFFLTVLLLKWMDKESRPKTVLVVMIGTRLLLGAPAVYKYLNGDLWSLPMLILHMGGIISGYLFLRVKKPVNLLPVALGSSVALFMFFSGWDYWIHRINYGTFRGLINGSNVVEQISIADRNGRIIAATDIRGKIVILEFWFTSCSACFEKFPKLQATYERYKNDPEVAIYGVNKPIEEDAPEEAFEVISAEGYSFPVAILNDDSMLQALGVTSYPTTIVLNRQGRLVYRGSIEGAVLLAEELRSDLK